MNGLPIPVILFSSDMIGLVECKNDGKFIYNEAAVTKVTCVYVLLIEVENIVIQILSDNTDVFISLL